MRKNNKSFWNLKRSVLTIGVALLLGVTGINAQPTPPPPTPPAPGLQTPPPPPPPGPVNNGVPQTPPPPPPGPVNNGVPQTPPPPPPGWGGPGFLANPPAGQWMNQGYLNVMATGYDTESVLVQIPLYVSYAFNGVQYDITVLNSWNPYTQSWNYGVDSPAYQTSYFFNGFSYNYYVNLPSGTFYFNL